METNFQNTFIPKTSLDKPISGPHREGSFLSFISIIILILSVVVAAGTYAWHQYLLSEVASIQNDLEKNENAFEPDTIKEYARLNSRFTNASSLLENHVSISALFNLLDNDTLKSVQFLNLKYGTDNTGSIAVQMSGLAASYNSLAYQAKVFSNDPAFRNVVFSNLNLDKSGNVVFDFSANIDPSFLLYKNNLSAYATDQNQDASSTVTDLSQSVSSTDTNSDSSTTQSQTDTNSSSNNQIQSQ